MIQIPTTVLLTLITIVELILTRDISCSGALWILYGIFYLIRWAFTNEKDN